MIMMIMMMMMMITAVTKSIFKPGTSDFAWKQIQIVPADGVDDDDDDDDDDDYSFNSVNFQARSSRFCMETDLYNIYQIMKMMMPIMIMIMMIMMMMKMIMAVTQSIFKLGPPDFAWKQIQIILIRQ